MSNFPAGSKIIITNADRGETYKNGDTFTVTQESRPGVKVNHKGLNDYYIASNEFKAYSEPFKVGDAVITTAANAEWEYKSGVEGTVTHIDTAEPKICVTGQGYVHTWDLKLAPVVEPERKFKVGDRVQITIPEGDASTFGGWFFVTGAGTVQEPEYYDVSGADIIRVLPDVTHPENGNNEAWNISKKYVTPLVEEPLDVTPRTITFADILKGDTIRAEYTQNGIKHTREGVAHAGWTGTWATEEGDYIAHDSWKGATYTLLERPEPPKLNPFAEAKVGSVAASNEGTPRYIWIKESEQGWRAYSVGGDYRSSHPTSDEALRADGTLKITYSAS